MYCSQCVCFRVCLNKHSHGTVLFSTRCGDAFSPGQSHMCPLLQEIHLHQCFHGWLGYKKHRSSTQTPQTISCFTWVWFLKQRALCLNPFGCKALLLLLCFYLLPFPVSLTFAHWSIKWQNGKRNDLISSVQSGKLPRSTLYLACIYSTCILLSSGHPKVKQSYPYSSSWEPEQIYHLETFFLDSCLGLNPGVSDSAVLEYILDLCVFKMLPR